MSLPECGCVSVRLVANYTNHSLRAATGSQISVLHQYPLSYSDCPHHPTLHNIQTAEHSGAYSPLSIGHAVTPSHPRGVPPSNDAVADSLPGLFMAHATREMAINPVPPTLVMTSFEGSCDLVHQSTLGRCTRERRAWQHPDRR